MALRGYQPPRVRQRRGATIVEYAVFMALVTGVVVVALEQLPPAISGTFTTVSGGIADSSASARGASSAPAATGPRAAPAAPAEESHRLFLQFGGIALCAGIWISLVVRRRRLARPLFSEVEVDREESVLEPEERQDMLLFAKRQQILASLIGDVASIASGEVAVRHVMSAQVRSVSPKTRTEEVASLMAEHKMRHLLVCEGEKLVGVISDRDLSRKSGRTAGEVMTRSPIVVAPDTGLCAAVTMMIRKRISCLPVIKEDRLVGLFTTTDLIMTLQCAFQLLRKAAPNLRDSTILSGQADDFAAAHAALRDPQLGGKA